MSHNLGASIRARLKQRADATSQDFNLLLTHYGLERLLYRLSISDRAPDFLLKGALLFSLWYEQPHRPTRDADLLGFGADDVNSAMAAFREICSIAVPAGLSEAFSTDTSKRLQWNAFLKKNRLDAMELPNVVARLRDHFREIGVI